MLSIIYTCKLSAEISPLRFSYIQIKGQGAAVAVHSSSSEIVSTKVMVTP